MIQFERFMGVGDATLINEAKEVLDLKCHFKVYVTLDARGTYARFIQNYSNLTLKLCL